MKQMLLPDISGSVLMWMPLYLITLFAGCMSLNVDVKDVKVPVLMNAQIGKEYSVVTHFSVEQDKPLFFLRRLFGGAHPEFKVMLEKQLAKTPGDAVINLRIKGETKEIDAVLPVVVGIAGGVAYAPLFLISLEPIFVDLKSYTIEGDIVRYTEVKKESPVPLRIDPDTGLPVQVKRPEVEYDPDTGLPKK